MKNKLIKIEDKEIILKEYHEQRVVTFNDIDIVHERIDGTAKRNFNENKEHFIEGVDYFNITTSLKNEIRTLEIPNRGITVLTESGYLMLVKSLNDDKAWEVQRQLINTYFKYKEIVKRLKPIDRALKQHMNIAETLIQATGVKPGIAYSVALNEAEKETGYTYDAYKKLLPSAGYDIGKYNATQVGKQISMKAIEVNKLLEQLGLQEKRENIWRLTEEGKEFAEEMPYTKNNHSSYQILWNNKLIEKLNCDLSQK